MSAEITKIIIESMPNLNVVGHPILVAIIGGLTGVFGMWLVQRSNIRMWRSDIFVKKMQEELVKFYDMLSNNIKEEYDSVVLSNLLNNVPDVYTNKMIHELLCFFEARLSKIKDLEEQFILVQPIFKKSLKFNDETLLKTFMIMKTPQVIYKYLCDSILEINSTDSLGWDDFFDITGEDCDGLQSQELKNLRDKFKLHCLATKIKLKKEDEKLYGDELKNDKLYYNAYLNKIRENLSEFKKLISEHMFKEF